MTTNRLDPIEVAAAIEGWKRYNTGGGCLALMLDNTVTGGYFLATVDDDADLPVWGEGVFVAEYDSEGSWLGELKGGHEWRFTFDKNANGDPAYSIEVNGMMIVDPFESECGRFVADPTESYGLPIQVARLLKSINGEGLSAAEDQAGDDLPLIDAAIDAMFAHVQDAISVTDGGRAAMMFQGSDAERSIRDFMLRYIKAERAAR